MRRRDVVERFWEKVSPEPNTGCWLWTGCADRCGYGILQASGGARKAHRIAWQIVNGPIPNGLCVLHRCDNPACVRAEPNGRGHLFLGTVKDNSADARAKNRVARLRGETNPMSRLTGEAIDRIRKAFRAGTTQRAIARAEGVSPPTVHRIVHGHAWKTP